MLKRESWQYFRIIAFCISYLAGLVLPRPVNSDYMHSSTMFFALELIAISMTMVFALVSLRVLRSGAHDEPLRLPNGCENPFASGQLLSTYDAASVNIMGYALGCMTMELLETPVTYYWQIPILLGAGVWLGVRLSVFVYRSEISNRTD
ncbi:hypothetical protein C8D83_10234 [Halothiobacillus neapolitanus]|nr:hypothetical protein C8D83_10234 [Halothiobacillus neapolitanus]